MHFSFLGSDRFDSDVITNCIMNWMNFLEYVVFEDNFILEIFMKLPLIDSLGHSPNTELLCPCAKTV